MIHDRGELNQPVEELLVVGPVFQFEPVVLPGVVGGVVVAGVVDGRACLQHNCEAAIWRVV